MTTAIQYDLNIEAETTFDESDVYFVLEADGNPIDLSGFSAEMDIRERLSSPVAALRLDTAGGGIVLNAIPGGLYMRMTREQTAFLGQVRKNRFVYDVLLIAPSGNAERIIEGSIIIDHAVTRDS